MTENEMEGLFNFVVFYWAEAIGSPAPVLLNFRMEFTCELIISRMLPTVTGKQLAVIYSSDLTLIRSRMRDVWT